MTGNSQLQEVKLLVGVGPSPAAADLIRTVQKQAAALGAKWFAVYVEDPQMLRLPEAERQRAVQNLRLAEQLGAETVTLRGRSIAAEMVNFARHHQVTLMVVGKPGRSRWQGFFSRSPVDDLVRGSDKIEVRIMVGEPVGQLAPPAVTPKTLRLPGYEMGLFYLILATVVSFLMHPFFDLPNLIMVYLLEVLVTAVYCGRGPALLNSLLSVLAFDVCFVPPRWTFTVAESKYFVTFAVMFLVAVVISHLTDLIRQQAEAARLQERQTAAMLALSRTLAGARGEEKILQAAVQHLAEIFDCQAVVLLPDEAGKLRLAAGDLGAVFHHDVLKEMEVAKSSYDSGHLAGWGTQNQPDSHVLYVPLLTPYSTLGVLALRPKDLESENWLLPEQLRLRLLESLAKQVSLALEVERLEKRPAA